MWHAARSLILGLLFCGVAWGETMPRGPVRGGGNLDVANPQIENVVIRNGTFALNLTNYGYFGNDGPAQSTALEDICNGGWAPQFEFPLGSDNQYLFQGALWIGAIIVEEGNEVKRVSVGTDGWFSPSINEFYPGEGEENGIVLRSNIPGAEDCFGNSIFDPEADANVVAIAMFSDTLEDSFWIVEDEEDGTHRPLGLEVTQTARCWTSPDFGEFVIFDFHIENIGSEFLKQLSLGLYVDADITRAGSFEGHTDDITGSIVEDPMTGNLIAWTADNDGRAPDGTEDSLIYPHCSGAAILGVQGEAPYNDFARSFNWWISNGGTSLDFGPSWTDSPDWWATYGTPVGDENKYSLLTGRERDYDQVMLMEPQTAQADTVFMCASDDLSHSWRTEDFPGGYGEDLADGYDTRFLLSVGPMGILDYVHGDGHCVYRLNPGEHVDLVAVLLLGEYFHDPNNPQPNPNDLDPSRFSFEGLRESMARARMLYEDGYNWQPPTPVTNLHVTDAMDGAVPLVWDEPLQGGHAGYRIYGRPDSGQGERVAFTPGQVVPQTNYTVTGLTNGDVWLFEVETWDGAGYRSAMAGRLVAVGAIPDDLNLSGSVEGNDATLTWIAVNDPTLSNYRVMRRSSEFDSTSFVVSGTEHQFVDEGLVSGRTYTYWVRAENSFGVPGLNSDPVSLTAFAPTNSILVFDETKTPSPVDLQRGAISSDSIRAWYETILTMLGETYAYYDRLPTDSLPSLEALAQYEMVIWHHENASSGESLQDVRARAQLHSDYIMIGGKLIRMGRQSLNSMLTFGWGLDRSVGSDLAPMTFDSLFASMNYYPMLPHNSTRTVGVTSLDSDFPSITWNPDRISQMRYQNQQIGFLPEIDLFWPNGNTWPLYSVNLHESDTLHPDGSPCAVIGPRVVHFGFPLYFIPQAEAEQLMSEAIEALRTQNVDAPETPKPLPEKIALYQNYPNPFNAMTTMEFDLPSSQIGALRVYNVTGQLVATLQNGLLEAGSHRVNFDASGLASGLYFYRLELGQQSVTRKMLLLK